MFVPPHYAIAVIIFWIMMKLGFAMAVENRFSHPLTQSARVVTPGLGRISIPMTVACCARRIIFILKRLFHWVFIRDNLKTQF